MRVLPAFSSPQLVAKPVIPKPLREIAPSPSFSASSYPGVGTLQAYTLPKFGQQIDPFYAVREFATHYNPRHVDGYTIHNDFFTPLESLDTTQLQTLLEDLKQKGTFDVHMNPKTGLVQTSDQKEGHHMSRQWSTDSGMMFYLQKDIAPDLWRKNMITNAAALNHPEARQAVESTVADPNWYRKGDVKNGVFHIYWPASVKLDQNGVPKPEKIQIDKAWFNQKRLESQAIILLRLVQTIEGGLVPGPKGQTKPWGFTPQELDSKAGDYILTAIGDLSQYLTAVNLNPETGKFDFQTPSASSWEELPLASGVTWDAALTVVAFERLKKLLYEDKSNRELADIRQKILAKNPSLSRENLERFITAGRAFVDSRITTPLNHGGDPIQAVERPYDSSLALLAGSLYRFCPTDRLEDAKLRLKLVQKTKKALLGENGMRRYNEFEMQDETGKKVKLHDSYLNIILPPLPQDHDIDAPSEMELEKDSHQDQAESDKNKIKPTDASDVDALVHRQALSSFEYTAEWQLGLSASLQALNRAKMDVLQHIQTSKKASLETRHVLKTINHEMLDLINRNLSAIPGPLPETPTIIRPDGTEYPAYKPVEAYQAVLDLHGNVKRVPGDHTLPWHTSQLYDGLKNAILTQHLEESPQLQKLLNRKFHKPNNREA